VTDEGKSGNGGGGDSAAPEPVVIRDKRRIDPKGESPLRAVPDLEDDAPLSGEFVSELSKDLGPSAEFTELQRHLDEVQKLVEEQGQYSEGNVEAAQAQAEAAEALAALAIAQSELAERTVDLQRLQAEFANYRKRVERDRIAVGEQAAARVLSALLPVLDDIERARAHGDLDGAFKAVAEQIESALTKQGLEPFGEVGDVFDPQLHEAVMHTETDDVDVPTCTTVMRKGYRQGERLLRPAMVGVSDPTHPAPVVAEELAETPTDATKTEAE